MCISIYWGDREGGKHFSIMKPILGLSKCSAASDKFIWNEEDSMEGIDIPVWIQKITEVDCSDEDCPEYCKNNYQGVFVNGINKHICYSYEVLDSICLIIKYDEIRKEYFFNGGCFPWNETYRMTQAKYGEEKNFNNVEIEIRDYNDPIIKACEMTDYDFNFGHDWRKVSFWLKIILFIVFVIIGYLVYDIYATRKKYAGFPKGMIGEEEGHGIPGGNMGFAM